jgi:hypothetical protein
MNDEKRKDAGKKIGDGDRAQNNSACEIHFITSRPLAL